MRKPLLVFGILANLFMLIYFKYSGFLLENMNLLFGSNFVLSNVMMPLGISFFTFQQLSFLIDTYRNEVPYYPIIDYALYVSFFPRLLAGPIITHDQIISQFRDKSRNAIDWENIAKGLYLFSMGLGKKVLISDIFGNVANWGFSNIPKLDSTNAIIIMLSYTIQIYFDFSGYCDMGMGISKILNIDLPINFNSPYKSFTITEFWSRWHMTLTKFFTKYLYIPLGGNRKGKVRTYINTMIVFLVSGMWHGANWTFLVWGECHGVFTIITKQWKEAFEKIHPALNWIITFTFVNFTWIIFRADSILDSLRIFKRIISLNFNPINSEILSVFNLKEFQFIFKNILNINISMMWPTMYLTLFFTIISISLLACKNVYEKSLSYKPTYRNLTSTVLIFFWSVISFAGVSTFLYAGF